MSLPIDPAAAARAVVWGGLALGLAMGAVGQSTRFCVRGSISDWVVFRGPHRLFAWVLAIAVGALGVQLLISLGLFDPTRAVSWSDRYLWLSYLVGGALFGYGMMIAPGCPQRCLVKAGAGDLKALVTLVLLAIVALMTLRGAFAGLRVSFFDSLAVAVGSPQDLGSIFGKLVPLPAAVIRWLLVLALLGAVGTFAWRVRSRLDRTAWLAGTAVGLLVTAAFFLTGRIGFVAEHPETLEAAWLGTQSRRPEGLSFSAPLAHSLDLLTLWSDKNTVATFGVMLALGVLLGSHVSARLRGEFRVESYSNAREMRGDLGGAVLMGFGGITALGCSIGNGVTGVAMLSAGALLAVAGMVGGALLALKLQMRRDALDGGGVPVPSAMA
ncbi:MAG: Lipocalin-related protein and Bos/Can/Equ allergen [uncultured Ramlibacter sp.]|uniref:Lipocalin-related protein and Bos/Can/Equ allergen n=1 Tax=uncultured Ramlibacter sp. TaxID=260755 RepID=A0A6J4NQD9_9BURK|nr:MAG: Lipocalin-related protein and Bos/Can/Equ allergen [uncultured Ramlibacter sp.]